MKEWKKKKTKIGNRGRVSTDTVFKKKKKLNFFFFLPALNGDDLSTCSSRL